MGKTKKPVYWVVDDSTYQKLQPLKRFVDFVAGLPYSTELHKRNAEEIKGLIETINQPETIKEWCVCLNIYDPMVQAGYGSGNYWKKWWVYFEAGRLEIEADDEILDEQHFSDTQPNYYGCIFFEKKITNERIWMDFELNDFIDDAMNYQKYITEGLNEVEVDIDIYSNPKEEKEDTTYSVPIW